MRTCDTVNIDGEVYRIGEDVLTNINNPEDVISLYDDDGDAMDPEDAHAKRWCDEVDEASILAGNRLALGEGVVI